MDIPATVSCCVGTKRAGRNQAYRLYRDEGLHLHSKLPRAGWVATLRHDLMRPQRPGEVRSLDSVADPLADGRKFRALLAVDLYMRQTLNIMVAQQLRSEAVVATLERVATQRRKPNYQFADNGSELSGQRLDWTGQGRSSRRGGATSM